MFTAKREALKGGVKSWGVLRLGIYSLFLVLVAICFGWYAAAQPSLKRASKGQERHQIGCIKLAIRLDAQICKETTFLSSFLEAVSSQFQVITHLQRIKALMKCLGLKLGAIKSDNLKTGYAASIG